MRTNDKNPDASSRSLPRLVRGILETCEKAGVEKVMAADHHGMIFLLSDGPEQRGGIVYRDDDLGYPAMKELAETVNAARFPNDKVRDAG